IEEVEDGNVHNASTCAWALPAARPLTARRAGRRSRGCVPSATSKRPVVAAIDMGYGHLRAALSLAEAFGVPLQRMEEPPLGDERDARFWGRTRNFYEALTRFSQLGAVSAPLGALVQAITAIPPPWPARDRSGPSAGTRWMVRAARSGAGARLA